MPVISLGVIGLGRYPTLRSPGLPPDRGEHVAMDLILGVQVVSWKMWRRRARKACAGGEILPCVPPAHFALGLSCQRQTRPPPRGRTGVAIESPRHVLARSTSTGAPRHWGLEWARRPLRGSELLNYQ